MEERPRPPSGIGGCGGRMPAYQPKASATAACNFSLLIWLLRSMCFKTGIRRKPVRLKSRNQLTAMRFVLAGWRAILFPQQQVCHAAGRNSFSTKPNPGVGVGALRGYPSAP